MNKIKVEIAHYKHCDHKLSGSADTCW